MGNFGLNAGIPWLSDTEGALCFIRKESEDNVGHFFLECRAFTDNFESIWSNLKQKFSYLPILLTVYNDLDKQQKVLLFLFHLMIEL